MESDLVILMVLTKSDFYKLIEDGALSRDVLDGVKKVDLERQKQNTEVGEGGDKKDLESGEVKENVSKKRRMASEEVD